MKALFDDGAHILYAGGSCRDETDNGKLMHGFSCRSPDDMKYPMMERASRYYKETAEGAEYMCGAFEEVRKESFDRGMQRGMRKGRNEERVSSIRNVMKALKITAEQAVDMLTIPGEEREARAGLI